MPQPNNYKNWLMEYEDFPTPKLPAPRSISLWPGERRPSSIGIQPGPRQDYTKPLSKGGARIPESEYYPPTPRAAQGIAQEPNSPWGVAIHDPLERQWVYLTPAGVPILRSRYPYTVKKTPGQWVEAASPAPYKESYGGGGGGGGWTGTAAESLPRWWDPGLMNWRYGVTY